MYFLDENECVFQKCSGEYLNKGYPIGVARRQMTTYLPWTTVEKYAKGDHTTAKTSSFKANEH